MTTVNVVRTKRAENVKVRSYKSGKKMSKYL